MAVTLDNYQRYAQRALDAYKAMNYDVAREYFLRAAEVMTLLSKQADSEELREVRRQVAEKALERAKQCEQAKKNKQTRPRPRGTGGSATKSKGRPEGSEESEGEDGADADKWIVKEKPKLRFDDVAGLDQVKEDIRLRMIYPFQHPELAARFDIRPGGGVLMYGPPGTGKTMLAKRSEERRGGKEGKSRWAPFH